MRATREFLTNASPSLPNRVYAIRLAPVMVDMNLPLPPPSLPLPLPLSRSLSLPLPLSQHAAFLLSLFRSPSLYVRPVFLSPLGSRVLSSLQSFFLFVSRYAPLTLPSLSPFPLRKFAMLHREEQKSISRGENWVTETSLTR
jgi:hypothetical protein